MSSMARRNPKRKCTINVDEIKRVKRDEEDATPLPQSRLVHSKRTARSGDIPLLEPSASDDTNATVSGADVSTSALGDDKPSHMLSEFRAMLSTHVASHPECDQNAPAMSKYLRNQFPFMGLKAPARRALQKDFLGRHDATLHNRHTMIGFVRGLWEEEEREFQAFGVDLLAQYREVLLGTTKQEFQEAIALCQHCVVTKSWWDTVDAISYPVVGYCVQQRPALGVPLMWQWIDHEYMWLRRVAILHQICLKEKTDQTLLFGLCLKRADEKEFFIRKAIGWALRDFTRTGSRAKEAVKDFVESNRTSLSKLSIKEALKHC